LFHSVSETAKSSSRGSTIEKIVEGVEQELWGNGLIIKTRGKHLRTW
jgi:hypothetical protein